MLTTHLPALSTLLTRLPARKNDAYKGDFGTVLIIGGSDGMNGAPLLAAMAAQRSGAGKVIIATQGKSAHTLINHWPSIMAYDVNDARALQPLLALATHIVIGPGLGQSAIAQDLLSAVLSTHLPLIVDADALNLLAKKPINRTHWVLTPHMGEAANLLATSINVVKADRKTCARALQKQYGGCIVLKGANTLITDDKTMWMCAAGNPGMASAGMGDVLSGVIAALAAQGLSLCDAAQLGVAVHAQAGDLAAQQGMRGMIATDLLPFIRQLVNLA